MPIPGSLEPPSSQTYFQLPNPEPLPQAPKARQPQAQQNEPSECRASQFGCCYDNVASAAGPLGEGCVGQPSYGEWMPPLSYLVGGLLSHCALRPTQSQSPSYCICY